MLHFQAPDGKYVLTFDDDGKVAYAYLKEDGEIVGAVWLYNRCPTPKEPEWVDRNKIPFANSKGYVKGGSMLRRVGPKDVLVDWELDERGPVAFIYIFKDLYGVIGVGDRPGYARFAAKDNPLARVSNLPTDLCSVRPRPPRLGPMSAVLVTVMVAGSTVCEPSNAASRTFSAFPISFLHSSAQEKSRTQLLPAHRTAFITSGSSGDCVALINQGDFRSPNFAAAFQFGHSFLTLLSDV